MISNIKSYIMPTYGERKLEFVRGKGAYLYSNKNLKFLDFGSGIAVNSLGHCHPKLINSLNKQSKKLWHTSNLYLNKSQENYARTLCNNSFAENVFFTNSGVESIECGIKIIRSFHKFHKNNEKKNIITFEGSFHGRSFSAMSAQKNKNNIHHFGPLLNGFIKIPFNNLGVLKKKIDSRTSAVLIETIQGEGGVRPASIKFLEEIKKLCVKNKALLFLDEVQCGFGRTGKLFCYEWSKIEPDIMAVAKGIGSGFPFGACLSTSAASIGMTKGMHGSTFGGNPLAISVGQTVLNEITKKKFLKNVNDVSIYLWNQLNELKKNYKEIVEIRGTGLLIGIKTKINNLKFVDLLSQKYMLTVPAADNVTRLVPPLIITKKEVDKAIAIISKVLREIND